MTTNDNALSTTSEKSLFLSEFATKDAKSVANVASGDVAALLNLLVHQGFVNDGCDPSAVGSSALPGRKDRAGAPKKPCWMVQRVDDGRVLMFRSHIPESFSSDEANVPFDPILQRHRDMIASYVEAVGWCDFVGCALCLGIDLENHNPDARFHVQTIMRSFPTHEEGSATNSRKAIPSASDPCMIYRVMLSHQTRRQTRTGSEVESLPAVLIADSFLDWMADCWSRWVRLQDTEFLSESQLRDMWRDSLDLQSIGHENDELDLLWQSSFAVTPLLQPRLLRQYDVKLVWWDDSEKDSSAFSAVQHQQTTSTTKNFKHDPVPSSFVMVTNKGLDLLKAQVQGILLAQTEQIESVATFVQQKLHSQSPDSQISIPAPILVDILDMLYDLNVEEKVSSVALLPGTLRRPRQSVGMRSGKDYHYTPHAFVRKKERELVHLFSQQGYITEQWLARARTQTHLALYTLVEAAALLRRHASEGHEPQERQSEPILVLSHAIIHADLALAPLEASMQEAFESKSWCELPVHRDWVLEDVQQIATKNLLPRLEQEQSTYTRQSTPPKPLGYISMAGTSSSGPTTTELTVLFFSCGLLDNLWENHIPALIASFATDQADLMETNNMKGGRTHKLESAPIPSIETLVHVVHQTYPELRTEDKTSCYDLCISDICQQALVPLLCEPCTRAIEQEYKRREELKLATVIRATKPKPASAKTILRDVPFDDPKCFGAACFYQIQSAFKFYEYARQKEVLHEQDLQKLEDWIRSGPFREFTRRIHEFSFARYDEFGLTFDSDEDLVSYCSAVEAFVRRYPPFSIASTTNSKPLNLIRNTLPGNAGAALSKQWQLCGVEPLINGSLLDFVNHVEEHTLTICGLPYRKADKKSERQFLAARKQALIAELESSDNPTNVLECAVTLLLQSTKGVIAIGDSEVLRGPVLQLLIQEKRKIPQPVSTLLVQLANQIQANVEDAPLQLVEQVRACALAKDISKHQV